MMTRRHTTWIAAALSGWYAVVPALVPALAMGMSATAAAAQPPASAAAAPVPGGAAAAAAPVDPRIDALKQEVAAEVDRLKTLTQQMVDQVFSYSELGFQETETSTYLTGILEKHGFRIERNYAGVPTAWVATWGSGKPVIALGSDIDGIPQASQKPGVAYRAPIVEGAPGHGEGHNSGVPLNITAAIAVKKIMERERLPGTLKIWPGVAEELVGTKAYFIRAGLFKDVDLSLFAHVGSNFGTGWGASAGTGLVSIEYTFTGEAAHAAANAARGKSALDAVELMDVGWNFRREHLRAQHRSHSVITNGGDQPNVVPSLASVWYYFRETDYEHITGLRKIGDNMATAAALMTDTTFSSRLLGSAWPQHMNKTVAETLYANITAVGLPTWDPADVALAKGIQRELKQPEIGLPTQIPPLRTGIDPAQNPGGPSDDIGDVSWNVPTATLNYPANIPNLPGHHWANAIAMATPLAHKGVTAGAKVQARTLIDLLTRPELVQQAWAYFRDVQTKDQKYEPLIGPKDAPATFMNRKITDTYRPELRKYYFDPTKYKTYLEQLGITYPTVR